MSREREKKYHHGDLKAALVAAGLAELEENGLAQLSLRSIAARVGVSHTAPKNHFDGLRGLLTAIAAEGFRRHAIAMRHGVEGEPPGKSRLTAASNGYVRFALENPELFKLMFSGTMCNIEDPDLKQAAWGSYEVLRGVARGLDWDKAHEPGSPWRTEWMLWSIVHGYATLLIEGQIRRNADGTPIFEMAGLLPDFGYLPGFAETAPPPKGCDSEGSQQAGAPPKPARRRRSNSSARAGSASPRSASAAASRTSLEHHPTEQMPVGGNDDAGEQ